MARLLAAVFLVTLISTSFANEVPVEDFFKRPDISSLRISPDGKHFAASVEINDEKRLAVLEAKTKKLKFLFEFPLEGKEVGDFGWLNNERVYASMVTKVGPLELPGYTGYLFAGNIDGKKKAQLLPAPKRPGKSSENPKLYSFINNLPDDPKHILVSLDENGFSVAYKLNVYSGRKRQIKKSPSTRAFLLADHDGNVKFSVSSDLDKRTRDIHILKDHDSDWELLASYDEKAVGISPINFTPDNKKVYLSVNEKGKTRGVYLFDLASKKMELVHELTGDSSVIGSIYGGDVNRPQLIGVRRMPNYIVNEFFNEEHADAKVYSSLMASFPEQHVEIVNKTQDGNTLLVRVRSDKNPSTFYLYDKANNKMEYLLDVLPWIKPSQMAAMEPFAFKARDGLEIRGYLTMPLGVEKNSPLVLLVHGGPYGVTDNWGFDREAQFLASRGFAVMQVNYRGSGGRTRSFRYDAYRQMGAEMQDDLTDATQWAIQSGIANKDKICIYGASYGGYAAMMGVVKEPDLYQCAIAYVGVYDIAIQKDESDTAKLEWGRNFLEEAWNAYDEKFVKERSPINYLDKLKADLFLVHGKEDKRVPVTQYNDLAEKLDAMNYPYQSLVKPSEGHGFVDEDNQIELYTKMARFLNEHIGK